NRLLGAIDHEQLDGPFLRIELQTELLLYRGEDRRPVRIDVHAVHANRLIARLAGLAPWHLIRRPGQIDVVQAGEPRLVHDDAAHEHAEALRELRERSAAGR